MSTPDLAALLGLLEVQAEHLYSTLLFDPSPVGQRLLAAVNAPRPGDWILVTFALHPIGYRIGRLIRVEGDRSKDNIILSSGSWVMETVHGELMRWSNCKVRRLLHVPRKAYGSVFEDQPSPEGEAWAAEALKRWGLE